MGEAINIPADKIVFDKSIYPRFEVDPERIQFFVELLENEAELDPIRVVKHDGSYVLIEGKHRLDAHKICGIYEISGIVEKIERKLWRLYAAKYNVRTSKPLSGAELKSVITKVYEIDGIKQSSVIAENLACTVRYVNKVLVSYKEADKQGKIARARELRDRDFSLQEIADTLSEEFGENFAKQTILNWLERDLSSKNGTVPFLDEVNTNSASPSSSDPSFSQENQQENTDQESVTFANRNKAANTPDSDREALVSAAGAEAEDPADVFPEDPEFHPESEVAPESPPDEELRPQPTFLAEAVSEFLDLEPVEEKTLIAAYMLLWGDDVESIARQVEEPPVWVRKTAAILAYTYWGYAVEDIMEKLEVTEDRAAIIGFVHQVMPKNIPPLEKLIEWINTNTKYHDDLMEMIRQEVIEQCFKAQDECELPQPVSEIPPDIDRGFIEAEKFLEDVLKMLEQRQFQGKLLEEIMLRFNGLQPVLNEIRQTLRKLV